MMHAAVCRTGVPLLLLLLAPGIYCLPGGMNERTVLQGLAVPVSSRALPDGRVLIMQQSGSIIIATTGSSPQQATYMQIQNTDNGNGCCGFTAASRAIIVVPRPALVAQVTKNPAPLSSLHT